MDTIPFRLHDPDAMLTETDGLAQVYENELVLQFETKDAFVGHFKQTREKRIPYEEISAVQFRAGWFVTELTIQALDIKTLEDIPGASLGRVRLRFKRRVRDAAAALADVLRERVADARYVNDGDDDYTYLDAAADEEEA